MSHEELRKLLQDSDKASRKALSRWATELEEEDPKLCAELLKSEPQSDELKQAGKRYAFARGLNRLTMCMAVLVIVGTYLISDFGMGLLEGLWNRYCMAMGIIVAMGLFAGGSLLSYRRKEELLAMSYLAVVPETASQETDP